MNSETAKGALQHQ